MPEAIIYIVCWLLEVMFPLKGEVWSTEIELVYQLVRHYYNFSVKYRSIPFNIYRLTTTTKKSEAKTF